MTPVNGCFVHSLTAAGGARQYSGRRILRGRIAEDSNG